MTDLERYRDEIDEIDSEIVRLFEKRMKVSEEVAEYKIKTGKQVLDPARESQKIHTLKNKAHGDRLLLPSFRLTACRATDKIFCL